MRVTLCRSCASELRTLMVDLGVTPLANSYVGPQDIHRPEPVYPLRVKVTS